MSKEFSTEDFFKNRIDLSKVCGGCRFFNLSLDECKETGEDVEYETPKCDKWRYFA
jgi:rRNA maturation protein Nop10